MATSLSGTTLKAKVVKSQLKLRTLTDANFGTLDSSANDKVTFLNRVFGTCVIGNDGLNVAVCCPNRNCGSYGSSAKKKLDVIMNPFLMASMILTILQKT